MNHRLSAQAEADLDSLWRYVVLDSGSFQIADSLIDSLESRFVMLTRHPSLGRERDQDLRPGMRSLPVGAYLILYRVTEAEILILRVIDGRRNLLALQT